MIVINIVKKIIKWFLIVIISLIAFFFMSRLVVKGFIYVKSKAHNEISEIREVSLGGVEQKILLEGKYKDAPILLVFHGGPAIPVPFGNAYRGYHKKLSDSFLLVEWDQYGCGNNPGDYYDLEVQDYVNMSSDLVKYLKEEFPNNEIYVFGISWGTILGEKLVNQMPELIDKYISYGTFTSMLYAFDYSKEELLKLDLSKEDREKIESFIIYNYDDLYKMQEIGINYNFNTQGMDKIDNSIYSHYLRLLFSPDYSIKDLIYYYKDEVIDSKIFNDIQTINVYKELENVNIPTYIIQGKYDNMTPHSLIDELVNNKSNFNYFELENSGHYPVKEDFDKMLNYIISLREKVI